MFWNIERIYLLIAVVISGGFLALLIYCADLYKRYQFRDVKTLRELRKYYKWTLKDVAIICDVAESRSEERRVGKECPM